MTETIKFEFKGHLVEISEATTTRFLITLIDGQHGYEEGAQLYEMALEQEHEEIEHER